MRAITRGAAIGLAVVASAFAVPSAAWAQPRDLIIFAAASLKNALDDASAAWARATGKPAPKISYAASNTLAKQIELGAPADIFVSADLDWMNYLAEKRLIKPDTRLNLLSNRIVLVAPQDSSFAIDIKPGLNLAAALGRGRLAIANVDAVPAGKYGKAALEKLDAWAGVKDRIAQADNVRAALLLVSRKEAPLGVVYATDAAADPNVKIVGVFPEDAHPPIIYPIAAIRESTHPNAAPFLDYLRSADARPLFEKRGFIVLNRSASGS